MNQLLETLALDSTEDILGVKVLNKQQFARRIVEHIVSRIDDEIDLAFELGEDWTASTLQGMSLEILNDFDMELPDDQPAGPTGSRSPDGQ